MTTVGEHTANLRDASTITEIKALNPNQGIANANRTDLIGGCGAGPEADLNDDVAGWLNNLILSFSNTEYGLYHSPTAGQTGSPQSTIPYKIAPDGIITVLPAFSGVEQAQFSPEDEIQTQRGAGINAGAVVLEQSERKYPSTLSIPTRPATAGTLTVLGAPDHWIQGSTAQVGGFGSSAQLEAILTFDLRSTPLWDFSGSGYAYLRFWVTANSSRTMTVSALITDPDIWLDYSGQPVIPPGYTPALVAQPSFTAGTHRLDLLLGAAGTVLPVSFYGGKFVHFILSAGGAPFTVHLTTPGMAADIYVDQIIRDDTGFRTITRSGDALTVGAYQPSNGPNTRFWPCESLRRLDDTHFAANRRRITSFGDDLLPGVIDLFELSGATVIPLTRTEISDPDSSFHLDRAHIIHSWGNDHLLLYKATSDIDGNYTHNFWVYTYDFTTGVTLAYATSFPFLAAGSFPPDFPLGCGRLLFPDAIVAELKASTSPASLDVLPLTWTGTALAFGTPVTLTPPADLPRQQDYMFPVIHPESSDHYTIVTYPDTPASEAPTLTCLLQDGTDLVVECGPTAMTNAVIDQVGTLESPTVQVIDGKSYIVFSTHHNAGIFERLHVGMCGIARGQATLSDHTARLATREPA